MEEKIYTFDKYIITYPITTKASPFECEWYRGITFFIGEGQWEVIHNYFLGYRLLISEKQYCMKDIPFYSGTFRFLPTGIEAREV
jgi:hypothetical protein